VVGTSRTVAVVGLRTSAVGGWRSDVSVTASAIRDHPVLLLGGIIGFALRGGIVLLTVPVLILPTQVEVRLALGGNLGSTGLTSGFFLIVGALAILTLGLALLCLYALARCELAGFTRFVNYGERGEQHAWPTPGRLNAATRRPTMVRLFVVESVTLLAILLAAVPLAAAIGDATLSEILLPSSTDSIYARILGEVTTPLAGFILALVFVEGISAVVVRNVLAQSFGLDGYVSLLRRPLRKIAVAVLGWVLFMGALAVGLVVLGLTWDAVRAVFLSTGLSGDLRDIVSTLAVALLFGAVYAAALLLCGLVSAFRSGLWTYASLR
jgi:hypothetical protein